MKNVKIINCTPHDIIIIGDEIYGDYIPDPPENIIEEVNELFVIEKSGIVPRLKEQQQKIDTVKTTASKLDEFQFQGDGYDHGWKIHVDIMQKSFSEIEGLPESKENTLYIVSALVAGACKDRDDLVVPNDIVRDDKGRIVGCRSLAKI